ncbi:hypothetical protein NESM_000348300 [Novymonas esmeraldas]|uniref:Yip1 domain-containing protein n=1 Tax=Novymonas esmeraldas TaxID=1808958 RepID=A0AAW0EKZ5_9TRYP
MAQQPPYRQYEGYAYPADYQAASQGAARLASPSTTSLSGATGLVRRSTPNNNNTSNTNTTGYQGSYGYFHGHANSIDVNSGYNSDVGSSASNALHGSSGGGVHPVTGASAYHVDVGTRGGRSGAAAASAANSLEVSPAVHASDPGPRGNEGWQSPQLPPPPRGPGVFKPSSEGRAGSLANSTVSSGSARPPAQQTFLPAGPFSQSSPLTSMQHRRQQQQQQPYVVPMPSSMSNSPQRGIGAGGTPPEMSFVGRSSTYTASPVNMSGPRMPAAYDHSATFSAAAATGGNRGTTGGFFSRLVAQVLPVLDDQAGEPGNSMRSSSGAPIGERPPHQLRFGNPADDVPLLEELGIFPRHIVDKARAVLNPLRPISVDAARDTDLAGPIVFAFSLAVLLSLRGKIQFSAIYGLFVLGVGFFKVLLSLMQPRGGVPLQFVASTIGYGLLPTVLLAVVRILGSWLAELRGVLPLTLLMVAWSAWCGTTLVAKGLGMEEQRFLVLYPMLLFYSIFNVVTVY